MPAALGTPWRFEKAGGAQRWKPANPSRRGRSGEPEVVNVNTSSCPSSSVLSIHFVSSLTGLLLLQSYKILPYFRDI